MIPSLLMRGDLLTPRELNDPTLEAFAELICAWVKTCCLEGPRRSIAVPLPIPMPEKIAAQLEHGYRSRGWLTADRLIEDPNTGEVHSFRLHRLLRGEDVVEVMTGLILNGLALGDGATEEYAGAELYVKTFSHTLDAGGLQRLESGIQLAAEWNKVTMEIVDPHTVVYTVSRKFL